ncbi:hypothetical protein CVT26_014195, partial [Gymnopilus dilepis]
YKELKSQVWFSLRPSTKTATRLVQVSAPTHIEDSTSSDTSALENWSSKPPRTVCQSDAYNFGSTAKIPWATTENLDQRAKTVAPIEASDVVTERGQEEPAPFSSMDRMVGRDWRGRMCSFTSCGHMKGEAGSATVERSSEGAENLTLREEDSSYIFVQSNGDCLEGIK